jgi:hypothetical protein
MSDEVRRLAGLSRSEALQRGGAAALGLSGAGWLAACSGGSSPGRSGTGTTAGGPPTGGTPVRGGTLRVGWIDGGASETLIPWLAK